MKRRTLATAVGIVLFLSFALAQGNQLGKDITRLNVRKQTEHYLIGGTVSEARLNEYARALEFIHGEYTDGFGALLNPTAPRRASRRTRSKTRSKKPAASDSAEKSAELTFEQTNDERFRVIIFATQAEYTEFGQVYFGSFSEHTRGMYVPTAKAHLVRYESSSQATFEILFHEAFHQFAHLHVPFMPIWLNEGLATHYGNARRTGSGLKFDRKLTYHFGIVRQAAAKRQLIPLDQLTAMTRAEFYDTSPVPSTPYRNRTLCYAQAYTLVGYMLSKPDGRTFLRKYVRQIAKATSPAQVNAITKKTFTAKATKALTPGWIDTIQRGHF